MLPGHGHPDVPTEVIVNLSDGAATQVVIPADGFDRGVAFYRVGISPLGSPIPKAARVR